VLLLTVPYQIHVEPREHFPELHEYALTSVGGKTVLVNRRRDGSLEVFEDLCFHGGDGSTLEQRVFTEDSIKSVLAAAGFSDVRIASEHIPRYGVDHAETWSLPIVARKGRLQPSIREIAQAYADATRRETDLVRDLEAVRADYQRHIAFHNESILEKERELGERFEWVHKNQAIAEERTKWAHSLEKDYKDLLAHLEHVQTEARAERDALEGRRWVRLGRKLGLLD
jgi:hypothetical protein